LTTCACYKFSYYYHYYYYLFFNTQFTTIYTSYDVFFIIIIIIIIIIITAISMKISRLHCINVKQIVIVLSRLIHGIHSTTHQQNKEANNSKNNLFKNTLQSMHNQLISFPCNSTSLNMAVKYSYEGYDQLS